MMNTALGFQSFVYEVHPYVFLHRDVFLYMIELTRILWGITGSGDRIEEILETMISLHDENGVIISVVVSRAGEQVLRLYKLWDRLHEVFSKVQVEINANVPLIAGPLQLGRYDLFIVAPLTANSTAKIAHGVADTLITNAVAQTLKGRTPVLLYPVDQSPLTIQTTAPDGTIFSITPRTIDLDNVEKLRAMDRVTILSSPSSLSEEILKHLKLN